MFGTTHTGTPAKKKRNVRFARHPGLLNYAHAFHYPPCMKKPRRPEPDDRTVQPFGSKLRRLNTYLSGFHLRDYWWRLLDFFEASRARRVALYAGAFLFIASLAAWTWAYPWWARRSAIRIAQQWLDAGQLHNAAEAAQRASELAPDRPEPWQIAAELARRGHQYDQALRYAHRAADLAPGDFPIAITLAVTALNAGESAEAAAILNRLPAAEVNASPEGLWLRGELARRDLRLTEARDAFEAAAHLEGAKAVNEVPLGLILLNATAPAERQRGLALLGKWVADREWGLIALRVLLEDAVTRNNPADMLHWADALRAHPGFTVSDMSRYLLALSLADAHRFKEVLAALEKDHAGSPVAAAQLLSWLNQIGHGAEAADWMKTLPPQGMQRPPLVVAGAEALRQAADWPALAAWTDHGDWGGETEFLRWSYGLLAARQLGDTARAEELWRTLYSHAQLNGTHGMFAGSSLYSWGRPSEAEALWWRVAEQEGSLAIEALGSLTRHYQVTRDADGQYRAFRQLHLLQPQNPDIGNNFAYFGLLLGREQRLAEKVARTNSEQHPENLDYLATLAFVSVQQGRYAEALGQLQSKASLATSSPGVAFVYGLALAGAGKKEEARTLLATLPPASLSRPEADLIKRTLGN